MHQCSKTWESRTVEEEAGLLLQLSLVVQEEASLPSFELRLLVGEAELSPEAGLSKDNTTVADECSGASSAAQGCAGAGCPLQRTMPESTQTTKRGRMGPRTTFCKDYNDGQYLTGESPADACCQTEPPQGVLHSGR